MVTKLDKPEDYHFKNEPAFSITHHQDCSNALSYFKCLSLEKMQPEVQTENKIRPKAGVALAGDNLNLTCWTLKRSRTWREEPTLALPRYFKAILQNHAGSSTNSTPPSLSKLLNIAGTCEKSNVVARQHKITPIIPTHETISK